MSICPLGLYSHVLDGLKPMMSVSQEPEGGNPFIKVGFSSPHPTPDVSWYIHHRPNSQSSYNSTYIPSSATNIDPSKCTMGILPSGWFVWSFRNYPKKQSENQPEISQFWANLFSIFRATKMQRHVPKGMISRLRPWVSSKKLGVSWSFSSKIGWWTNRNGVKCWFWWRHMEAFFRNT